MLTMLYIMLCSSITTHSVYTSRYTEVFSGGGWQMKVGSLKKCAVYFKSNPTKLHECLVSICSVAMYCMTVDVYLISMFLRIRDTDTCSLFFWGGMRWLHQREALILFRNENPDCRIRSADQLGTRTCLATRELIIYL